MPHLENRFTRSGQARTNDEIQDRNEEFTGVKNQLKKKKPNRLSFLCSARRSLVAVTTSLRFKRCAQPLGTNDILLCVGLQRHFGASPQSYNKTNREES